ncbi:MAG: DUF4935 domain-containing protein [Campylobacterales bacterium]|nr:DUF4935 domain-containing protein [Campylobacterales bacterium]
METIFLDANILLDFFRFGPDDIAEMEKLVTLIKEKEVRLITNSHLLNEVARNRSKVISQSLNTLSGNKFSFAPPRICDDTSKIKEIRKKISDANKLLAEMVLDIKNHAEAETLAADKLISDLFSASKHKAIGAADVEKARLRVKLGNPPGKPDSLGDAIHWEGLIQEAGGFASIISRDADFASPLNELAINPFLAQEWKGKYNYGCINLYKSLSSFFAEKFPDIRLSTESEKNELIEQLERSSTFQYTHDVIEKLSKHKFFTNAQVARLFEILVENNQVSWIASDEDVRSFYLSLQDKAYWVSTLYEEEIAKLLDVDKDDFFMPF